MSKKKIFSDEEIELMIANTNASIMVEGFEPSAFAADISREFLKGSISENEAISKLEEEVKRKL
jgi:hypothetical protein